MRLLFQRLYNWIRYKTLPSSFLFKNRLFLEKDSKNKRIMTNFGLIFKNSKWKIFQTYNIKINFKFFFKKKIFIFIFLFLFLILIFNKKNYLQIYFSNELSFLFWINLDSFDYYLSFFLFFTAYLFSYFFNLIYLNFFFNFKTINKKKTKNKFKIEKNINLTNFDLNWITYSWLINQTNELYTFDYLPDELDLIDKLFDDNENKKFWNSNFSFFINLYKNVFSFNLINKNNNIFFIKNKISETSKINFFFFNNNSLINKFSKYLFWNIINLKKNYFNEKNLKKNNNFKNWNLYNFNLEIKNNKNLLLYKNNFFYFSNLNQTILNLFISEYSEFLNFNNLLINQNLFSKWNRWLYKYSILHRKFIKNSHKITLTKKLLTFNFYNKFFFKKNLWNSEHLSNYKIENLYYSFFNIFYSNLFQINKIDNLTNKFSYLNNFNESNSYNFLKNYENSYFWFFKKFFFFNTLSNNQIKIKHFNFIKKEKIFEENNLNDLNNFFLIQNYLNNSFFFNSNFLIIENFNFYDKSKLTFNLKNKFKIEEFSLLLNDEDLFNKNNFLYLLDLTSSSTSYKNNFNYFNYFIDNKKKKHFFFFLYTKKFYFNTKNIINYFSLFSNYNFDNQFYKDFKYFTFFI
uniref:CcmF n=1 Tax=Paraurostyla sp. TaxID=6014 RepID=A0A3Q8BMQ7_9STIC|nr:ccmF [Paraurostyla sp.]